MTPGSYIITEDGDKLGIYNEDYSCPLAYRLGSSSDSALYNFIEPPKIGNVVSFDSFGFPDEYSVEATYDTGNLRRFGKL